MIAAGTSAHSDHARGMVETLLAVAEGQAKDFKIKDVTKLYRVAGYLEIEIEGRPVNDVAKEVALTFIEDFGRQQGGEINYAIKRAPKKTQERWRKWGIVPRSIDREVVEMMHRTNIGVDHEPDHVLLQGLRTALADGWGGSMISTDITDILFGTPHADQGRGELRHIQGGRGQSRCPRPRAAAGRDDRRRGQRAGDGRICKDQGRQGHQPRRHVLHGQRDPDAPRHPDCRRLHEPGARDPDRAGRC